MSSVPLGRAANHPLSETTLTPPSGASLPGARVSTVWIGSPASSVAVMSDGSSRSSFSLLSASIGESVRL